MFSRLFKGLFFFVIALGDWSLLLASMLSGSPLESAIAMFQVSVVLGCWTASCILLAFVHNACLDKFQSSRSSVKILSIFSFISHDWLLNL